MAQSPARRSFSWNDLLTPGHMLEALCGLVMLLMVAGYSLYTSTQEDARAAHYRAGLDAVAHHDLDRALSEFRAAQGYRDAAGRVTATSNEAERREELYSEGLQASEQGNWWAAAFALRQMESIQAGYKDANRLLARARNSNGIVLYTLDRAEDHAGGLHISAADGGDIRLIPGTGTGTQAQVHAISEDGAWVVYSLEGQTGREVYLYSVVAGTTRRLDSPGRSLEVAARFAPDKGHVWVATGDAALPFDLPYAYDTRALQPDVEDRQASDGGQQAFAVAYADRVRSLLRASQERSRSLPAGHVLADGETMLTVVPPLPVDTPGLYAYDLHTGEAQLAIEGAAEAWYPGYSTLGNPMIDDRR